MAGVASLGEAPFLVRPDPNSVFESRAKRLRDLAGLQHGMAGYLQLVARIAEAQQTAVGTLPALESDRRQPPPGDRPDPLPFGWRASLEVVNAHVGGYGPEITRVVHDLEGAPAECLEDWARAVSLADYRRVGSARAALIAAALQVAWTAVAARPAPAPPAGTRAENRCPVCGSRPVASVITGAGAVPGLRYLCCSLCSARWNLPRVRCVRCGSGKTVAYYAVEGSDGAVGAEACEECKTYCKILNLAKDPGLDPFADDLASLPLDVLLADAGFVRFEVNPFLIPGE